MSTVERIREAVSPDSAEERMRHRSQSGWRLVAMEWERDKTAAGGERSDDSHLEPVPYGLRVALDCRHLESDPQELEVLTQVAQMIVHESRLPEIAEALNRKGHRTRNGQPWTPSGVFELMPRLIDTSPRIFATPDWPARRRSVTAVR